MKGQDGGGKTDAHAPRAGRGDAGERGGIDGEAVIDEVVLGEPDLVEPELFGPLHLLELTMHDVLVREAGSGLEEEEGPEAHGAPDGTARCCASSSPSAPS